MEPQFRIKKNENGKFECYYVVKKTFFGKEILKPYITYFGSDTVYPFSSIKSLTKELEIEVIKKTKIL